MLLRRGRRVTRVRSLRQLFELGIFVPQVDVALSSELSIGPAWALSADLGPCVLAVANVFPIFVTQPHSSAQYG